MHFDLPEFIKAIGYIGLFGLIFAESGLLIGLFFPGDSVLFTAGFLASQDLLSLPILLVTCFAAAVLGDNVGYAFGHRFGKKLFKKDDSFFFHKDHIRKAQSFYEKHGAKTIVLARFMPVIRTFAPIVAGVGSMHYRTFLLFNLIGGLLWAIGLNLAGYFLGSLIPDVDKYLIPIVLLIIILSILPTVIHILKDRNHRESIFKFIKTLPQKLNVSK